MRTISIGAQGFEDLIQNGYFYIDKTDFIREWWESGDVVTLITRPRRFGKTLNMSMLECFFSNQYAGHHDLFEHLSIWQEEKYRRIQGTYPVIFLSFANVKERNYSDAREALIRTITGLFQRLKDKWETDSAAEKARYAFMNIGPESSDAAVQNSLHDLSAYLEYRYGQKCLIFLDEYDTPLQEAFINGYWEDMSAFIRGLFNATFKTNPSLARAIMTGITRVSKESIFSELNNLAVITSTSTQYEKAFGFTEREVFTALDEYGLTDQRDNVRRWYDGFTFGNAADIYNPWSIINYIKQKRFAPYWANTSSNSLISYELRKSDIITKDQMVALMNGGTLETRLDEQIIYSQLDLSAEALWSLFLASGYLRIIHSRMIDDEYWYTLSLTNLEVQLMFRNMIGLWFDDVRVEYGEFMQYLVAGDAENVERCLEDVLLNKASYFDTKKERTENRRPESFYHGLVLGMVAQEREYLVQSNGESGFGRYDVMMVPRNREESAAGTAATKAGSFADAAKTSPAMSGRTEKTPSAKGKKFLPAIIMEFKLYDQREEDTLEQTAERALRQIVDRKYDAWLVDAGFSEDEILKYGIGFCGKKVAVKKGVKKDLHEHSISL